MVSTFVGAGLGYILLLIEERNELSFLFSLVLNLLISKRLVLAQDPASASSTVPIATSSTSLTPAMSSSSVASYFSALATSVPIQPGNGPSAGDAGSSAASSTGDSDAGAAGSSSGSITISKGGMVAIIIVVVCVVIFGSAYPTENVQGVERFGFLELLII